MVEKKRSELRGEAFGAPSALGRSGQFDNFEYVLKSLGQQQDQAGKNSNSASSLSAELGQRLMPVECWPARLWTEVRPHLRIMQVKITGRIAAP